MSKLTKLPFLLTIASLSLLCTASWSYAAPGDLYVADNILDEIDRFVPSGNKTTFASGLSQPVELAFDSDGNLFVGDSGSGIGGPPRDSIIYKYAPNGMQSTFVNLGPVDLWAMAFDGTGNLFVSTGFQILKITPDGTQTTFASDLNTVSSLAFDTGGNLYAGLIVIGPGSILKFTPDGESSTFFTADSSDSVIGLAFDRNGNLFAALSDSVVRITPDGNSTIFASVDLSRNALAFDGSGHLFAGITSFSSSDPAILKLSTDGTETTFAFGPLSPTALAFEPVTQKLRNISARGLVGTGNDVLIGGFIVGGNALANNAVLLRAIGPSLSGSGVSNPLADPTLELHNASGALITSNDDWQDTQEELISATGIPPADPKESAIYATLPAGNYTAVVRGAGDTTGTALVEVYSINQ